MAYTLTYSGGTITVTDGTINTSSTSLALPGRNYAGYGAPVDQNMVSMLENFASNTSGPSNPIKGQWWFDAVNNVFKYNVGTYGSPTWVQTAASGVGMNVNFGSITGTTITATTSSSTPLIIGSGAGGTGILDGTWTLSSGSTLTIQKATTTQLGIVKVDGTTITAAGDGTISATPVAGVSSISFGVTGLTPNSTTTGAVTVAGTLSLTHGGTGATTQAGAANAILPSQGSNSGKFLTTNGSNVSWASLPSGGVTSVGASAPLASSGGTTPSISLTGTVAIANGGTGQATANDALNALLPSQGSNNGKFLTTNGTNSSWADVSFGTPSIASTGYMYLPNGMIMQWGSVAIPSGGNVGSQSFTFPLNPFPNALFSITGNADNVANGSWYALTVMFAGQSASGATVYCDTANPGEPIQSGVTVKYIAIGY